MCVCVCICVTHIGDGLHFARDLLHLLGLQVQQIEELLGRVVDVEEHIRQHDIGVLL